MSVWNMAPMLEASPGEVLNALHRTTVWYSMEALCFCLPLLASCDNATKVDDKAHLLKLFHLSLHACGSSTTWGR